MRDFSFDSGVGSWYAKKYSCRRRTAGMGKVRFAGQSMGIHMNLERNRTCCFTGHRRIPAQDGLWVRRRLREEIAGLAARGVTAFLAGGALGFDTMAAQEVLRVRGELYPGLRLVLVLPCLGQETLWSERDAAVYRSLLRQADEIIYTGEAYTQGCMFRRNRYLVDHSAYCICFFSGRSRGGTAYTVKYAQDRELTVVNLAESLRSPERLA